MKKASLPDSHTKRKILYDKKIHPEDFIRYGDLFFKESRYVEAWEFYRKASFTEGIEKIKSLAIQDGDSFLYETATKGYPDGQDLKAWEELGKRAFELKKYSHAIRAFQRTGNASLLEEAEQAFRGVINRAKA